MPRQIKFIVSVVKWFDKVNGNTYHSVKITRCRDSAVIVCPFQYGYGDQYKFTTLKAMTKEKWIPVKYRSESQIGYPNIFVYERENNYPIYWQVSNGLKRECVSNGEL